MTTERKRAADRQARMERKLQDQEVGIAALNWYANEAGVSETPPAQESDQDQKDE